MTPPMSPLNDSFHIPRLGFGTWLLPPPLFPPRLRRATGWTMSTCISFTGRWRTATAVWRVGGRW